MHVSADGATKMREASPRALWLDDFQRRHPVVAFPIAVVYKFFDDSGTFLAAQLSYYGFVSIFPLLLVLSTVLSVVLRQYPELQRQIVDSSVGQIPIIGPGLKEPDQLSGGLWGAALAVAFAAYGALGVGQSVQYAMNAIWAVPRNSRPNPFSGRLRSLLLIVLVGLVLIATTAVSALGGMFDGTWATVMRFAIPIVVIVVDALLFIPIFRHGPARHLGIRQVLPGAIVAAVGWGLLQRFGVEYAKNVIARASDTNSIFASVLGLFAFLYLASVLTMFCAEINVVRTNRLYPRALLTPFTDNVRLTGGDKRTYTALAKAQRHKGFESIEVSFDEPPDPDTVETMPIPERSQDHAED